MKKFLVLLLFDFLDREKNISLIRLRFQMLIPKSIFYFHVNWIWLSYAAEMYIVNCLGNKQQILFHFVDFWFLIKVNLNPIEYIAILFVFLFRFRYKKR